MNTKCIQIGCGVQAADQVGPLAAEVGEPRPVVFDRENASVQVEATCRQRVKAICSEIDVDDDDPIVLCPTPCRTTKRSRAGGYPRMRANTKRICSCWLLMLSAWASRAATA